MKTLGGLAALFVALVIGLLIYNANYKQGPEGIMSPVQRLMQAIELV